MSGAEQDQQPLGPRIPASSSASSAAFFFWMAVAPAVSFFSNLERGPNVGGSANGYGLAVGYLLALAPLAFIVATTVVFISGVFTNTRAVSIVGWLIGLMIAFVM